MASPTPNYRDYLRTAFERRARAKARYSLNTFAKEIGLAPSRLSEIFSGKQGLSREFAERIALAIDLPPGDIELFCDLVEMEHGRSAENRRLAQIRLGKRATDSAYVPLQADMFVLISDWYHFAILQLTELPNFSPAPRWIAEALGISRGEAEGALARLLRLEVLEAHEGSLRKTSDFLATSDGVPSAAIRQFHQQILSKAAEALIERPMEERNFSANYATINRARLPEAKEMMKRFRRRFARKFDEKQLKKNSVYCLSMQLFELTQSR